MHHLVNYWVNYVGFSQSAQGALMCATLRGFHQAWTNVEIKLGPAVRDDLQALGLSLAPLAFPHATDAGIVTCSTGRISPPAFSNLAGVVVGRYD